MFKSLKNKLSVFTKNNKQDASETLNQKLIALTNAITQIERQTYIHYEKIESLETEIKTTENKIEFSLKKHKKAEAEYLVSELSLLRNSYTQKKKIYDHLLSNLSDLKHTKQNLKNKLQQFESEKEILNAKLVKEQSVVEIQKNIRELEGTEELKDQLLEAECLTEAFEQINGKIIEDEVKTTDLQSFEKELDRNKQLKEESLLEKLSLQMGKKEVERKDKRVKELLTEFEQEKTHIQNSSKEQLVKGWLSESKNEDLKLDDYKSFFDGGSKDKMIDDFFND